MWRAVARGYVRHEHATFIAKSLRHGFEAGVQRHLVRGQRCFPNYKSARDAMEQVGRATQGRVDSGKTLALGDWGGLRDLLFSQIGDFRLFPLSAVDKPLEPGEKRPASDHTKTGLNAATVLGILEHSLTAAKDVAWMLQTGYFMYVSDVEAAFTMLPLAPWLWWFMLFCVTLPSRKGRSTLCMHTHGDFGTRGMPGCFYVFYVKVVIPMARSELILTLPMAVYVDDNGLCAPTEAEANGEMGALQDWCAAVPGVAFKRLKDRRATQTPLYIGFIWNSVTRTRTLPEQKLLQYMDEFNNFANRRAVTLTELRSLAGKAQRAVLTMPPGAACLLANMFALMAGLTLPWHKKRVTKGAKLDVQFLADVLGFNVGQGYFSYDQFGWAPELRTDACKGPRYTGGGYVSACGRYGFWRYGTSAARKLIDEIEGDTFDGAIEEMAGHYRRCMVPCRIDNSSFQRSQVKGRSRAPRLNDLMKKLFVRQIRGEFVLSSTWISSEDNELADDLSRDREVTFLQRAVASGFWHLDVVPLRHPQAGRTRTFAVAVDPLGPARDVFPGHGRAAAEEPALASDVAGDEDEGPVLEGNHEPRSCLRLHGAGGVTRFSDSVPHPHATLTEGLPAELLTDLEDVLDNRLAASSYRSVGSGMVRWRDVAEKYGWPTIIRTHDPTRGAKMVALVLHMVHDTELVWSSINNYVWGVRQWMQLQHQADPVLGVDGWDVFCTGCKVLAHVPAEPRKQIPLEVVEQILHALDPSKFEDAQFGFFLLVMLFTFSRSECPCPKSFSGPESFDELKHWQVGDIVFVVQGGMKGFRILFKSVKQDARVERPQARGEDGTPGDWAYVGDVPGTIFSVVDWYMALCKHTGKRLDKAAPFFLAKDKQRPYTYRCAMSDLHRMLDAVGCTERYGLHGLRVLGYNLSKRANGVDLTVAHGLWMSSAHTRYERFSMQQVMCIPRNMVGCEEVVEQAEGAERPVHRARLSRRSASVADAADAPPPNAPVADGGLTVDSAAGMLPEGYTTVVHSAASRAYHTYLAPDGTAFKSRIACWRHFDAGAGREAPRTPASGARGLAAVARRVSAERRARVSPAVARDASPSTSPAQRAPAPAPAAVPESPVPGSYVAADVLGDIVPYFERPSARRVPARRG